MVGKFVRGHRDLEVYKMGFEASMQIFELSKKFPDEERYALTDQIRRSSRAVCANVAEGWRRRRYGGSFIMRLNDSEAEAAETQTWLEFAVHCHYMDAEVARKLYSTYDEIIKLLVAMIVNSDKWLMPRKKK